MFAPSPSLGVRGHIVVIPRWPLTVAHPSKLTARLDSLRKWSKSVRRPSSSPSIESIIQSIIQPVQPVQPVQPLLASSDKGLAQLLIALNIAACLKN